MSAQNQAWWSAVRHAPRWALIGVVKGYRLLLSPWLGSACRFEPTCSAYALAALQTHGAAAGTYLAAGRILRCRPGCAGGHDPVPAQAPAWFRRFDPKPQPEPQPGPEL